MKSSDHEKRNTPNMMKCSPTDVQGGTQLSAATISMIRLHLNSLTPEKKYTTICLLST